MRHERTIRAVIAQKLRLREEDLDGELTLDELGLDSLTAAEVVFGVEREVGRKLQASALGRVLHRDSKLNELLAALDGLIDASAASMEPA